MLDARTLTKWSARFIGLVASAAMLGFLVGEALDGLCRNADPAIYIFLPMMIISIAGCVFAWSNARWGGAITLLGGLLMFVFHLYREDSLTAAVYGVPFILTGLLFIISGCEFGDRSSGS